LTGGTVGLSPTAMGDDDVVRRAGRRRVGLGDEFGGSEDHVGHGVGA